MVAAMEFIAQDRPRAARKLADKIRAEVKPLGSLPRLGSMVREFGDESIRQVVVKPFRIVYRVEADGVVIIAVVHGRRLLANAIDLADPETR